MALTDLILRRRECVHSTYYYEHLRYRVINEHELLGCSCELSSYSCEVVTIHQTLIAEPLSVFIWNCYNNLYVTVIKNTYYIPT